MKVSPRVVHTELNIYIDFDSIYMVRYIWLHTTWKSATTDNELTITDSSFKLFTCMWIFVKYLPWQKFWKSIK